MNGTHEDQVVWQPADQLRGAPGNVRQHEPPPLPGGLSGPSWRRAPATGAPGLCAVAGLQRIAGADESAATSPPLETSVAGRITRSDSSNWSDIELAALDVAVAQAKDACIAR